MMKRALSILIDAGLFLITLLAWGIIAALSAGFLEIAFAWKVFSSTAGLIVLAVVILLGSGFLSIAGPRVAFGQTPGMSLLFRKQDLGLKPVIYWSAWLGILAAVYFVMLLTSVAIFNPMATRQRAALQAMGLPADWKQAFPEYSAEDNAAPLLKLAGDSLKAYDTLSIEKTIDWAFRLLSEVPDSIPVIWPTVDRLTALNAGPLEWADKASRCGRLCWHDYRNTTVDSIVTLSLPNYVFLQRLCKLSMLQVVRAVRMGRTDEAKAVIGRTQRLLKLQTDDPTLIGKVITMVQVGIISNGLASMARIEPRSYGLIRDSYNDMPDVSGQVRKGLIAESSTMLATLDNYYMSMWGAGPKRWRYLGRMFGGGQVQYCVALLGSNFYRIWAPWDRYCYMKSTALVLEAMKEGNTRREITEREKLYNTYKEKRNRIPALFTNIVMGNFILMYKRELEARAKPANALLFAAALNCRRERGVWPKGLAALVPVYFPELPQNPVDGEHYTYILTNDRMEVRGNDSKGEALLKSTVYKF